MTAIRLDAERFRDKVRGCWMGKNIGGTLGAPYEGQDGPHALTFYDPVPQTAAANDDLDLQLVWLEMLEEKGAAFTMDDLAAAWMEKLAPYPWNEYGVCQHNLRAGLRPPLSGCFRNTYVDEMGAPIRSEIWACVAPANPQYAAWLAWKDAVLDHAGGEGVWGEMFWAALQSAAFVESDPHALLQIGLAMIPLHSAVARAVREAIFCQQRGLAWREGRERIRARVGHPHAMDAPQNHGYTVLGWLLGKDFGDRLCIAVNCGADTDCTGATLGALLGILAGAEGIPARWKSPVGAAIQLHKYTNAARPPRSVEELTDRTVALAERFGPGLPRPVAFGGGDRAEADLLGNLSENRLARLRWNRDPMCVVHEEDGIELEAHYAGEPLAAEGNTVMLEIGARRVTGEPLTPDAVELDLPPDWTARRRGDGVLGIRCDIVCGPVADRNAVTIRARFGERLLAMEAIFLREGFLEYDGSNLRFPVCEACGAYATACVCDKK